MPPAKSIFQKSIFPSAKSIFPKIHFTIGKIHFHNNPFLKNLVAKQALNNPPVSYQIHHLIPLELILTLPIDWSLYRLINRYQCGGISKFKARKDTECIDLQHKWKGTPTTPATNPLIASGISLSQNLEMWILQRTSGFFLGMLSHPAESQQSSSNPP